MKFCSFYVGSDIHVGIKTPEALFDLTAAGYPADMHEYIIACDSISDKIIAAISSGVVPKAHEEDIRFANVSNPGKLLCVGLNYADHAAETDGEPPEQPVFFSKFNDCLTPAGESVELPQWQRCYDYEAELVIVIGKPAWHVTREQAGNYIFGYTCGNDLSVRDCQFISGQWLQGKSFPGFAPAGPYIVTKDEFDPSSGHAIRCTVNGAPRQESLTSNMIFDCETIIEYASRYFKLQPGDLIYTGTPSGVILGMPKDERVWLTSGDIVTVSIDGIGELVTPLT